MLCCRLNSELLCKVSDFGLSHGIHEKNYYRAKTAMRPLPVKWMSTESLETGVFTTMSDVVSYNLYLIICRMIHSKLHGTSTLQIVIDREYHSWYSSELMDCLGVVSDS